MNSSYQLLVHRTTGEQFVVAQHVTRAESFLSRLRGLIGSPPLADSEALWFEHCRSVHMFFMRTPIDVVFYADNYTILHLQPELQPWAFSSFQPAAAGVVELSPGSIKRLALAHGDQLDFQFVTTP